jgi:DNA-binding transcriptional LysR family regulator
MQEQCAQMHIVERPNGLDWDDLRVFLAVARAGSLTAASASLGLVHTTVSRRISNLERRIGARLLARHSRGMQLTQRGRDLALKLGAMEASAAEVEGHLFGSGDTSMAGVARVAATDGLASYWLVPQLIAFHRAYPAIRVEIATVNSWGELAAEESDIALRYARPISGAAVSRKVGRTHFGLYAAQTYLDAYDTPRTLSDLARHTLIENVNFRTNAALSAWQQALSGARTTLSANSAATVLASVRAGSGIALLPTFFEAHAPDLIMLDIPLRLTSDMWLLSHAKTNKTPRIRALLTYIAERFARDRARWFF